MLPLKRCLSEETRLQTVMLKHGHVYDFHRDSNGDYCITEHGNSESILMLITTDLWDLIFESEVK